MAVATEIPPAGSDPEKMTKSTECNSVILFADIVGFSTISYNHSLPAIVNLVHSVYSRLRSAVEENLGSIQQYTGDGVMASFHTSQDMAEDSLNGLHCATAIIKSFADWNITREKEGEPPLPISVGMHYGRVAFADLPHLISSDKAIVGNAVNIASRIENITREIGCDAAVSCQLFDAAKRAAPSKFKETLRTFKKVGPIDLRGIQKKVYLRTYSSMDRCARHSSAIRLVKVDNRLVSGADAPSGSSGHI